MIFCLKTYLQFYIYNRLPTDLKKSTIASTIGSSLFVWKITFCQASLWNYFSWLYILPSTNLSGEVISYYQSLWLDPHPNNIDLTPSCMVVVFPAPLRPKYPKHSPSGIPKYISSEPKKRRAPKRPTELCLFFDKKWWRRGKCCLGCLSSPNCWVGKWMKPWAWKSCIHLRKKSVSSTVGCCFFSRTPVVEVPQEWWESGGNNPWHLPAVTLP